MLTPQYLAQAEKDGQKWQKFKGTPLGTLGTHCVNLVAEVRRLQTPPPPKFPVLDAINANTMAMLARANAATDRTVYLSQDPYAQRFVRNPSCWIGRLSNVSCFSPAQLSGTPWNQRAGTLITKRHIVYAKHFGLPILDGGTPILFVDSQGGVVERKVIASASEQDGDIAIGLLDADVPDGIRIAPVLPPDFDRHLGFQKPFLVVTLDQEERASVQQCNSLFSGQFSTNTLMENYVPQEYKRFAAWSEQTVVGDSGNPVFVIIGNELVLIGCWWMPNGGPHLGSRHAQVNKLIAQLAPGYSLTVRNL